jgi:hypothetical protein
MIRRETISLPCVLLALLSALFVPARAQAQGKTFRTPLNPTTPVSAGTAGRTQVPVDPQPAWLDDAETLDPGTASAELSVGRWAAKDGGQTDGPVLELTVGLTSQIQLSATLPYYRASYTDGYSASGRGDTYLAAKFQLLDPSDHAVGVSVQPLLEILSDAAISDETLGLSRVNWGLPITVQVGSDKTQTRAYASAGYFSRHAVFVGGAVERDVSSSVTLIGTVNYSEATSTPASSDLLGLSRARTDATGMIYVNVARGISFFAGAGRTISKLDQNGAKFIASAGVRFETARRARP